MRCYETRTAVSIAMLCLLVVATTAGAQVWDAKKDWSVHPLTLRQPVTGDKTMPVWIGLRNERRVPQMVCVGVEAFTFDSKEEPMAAARGGSHSCRGDDQFKIVLPGETYFHVMSVDVPKHWQAGTLELSLQLATHDDAGETQRGSVTWSGPISALVAAGEKVAPRKAQPR